MDQSELTGKIIGCARKVHSILGPGLLESAYRICSETKSSECIPNASDSLKNNLKSARQ